MDTTHDEMPVDGTPAVTLPTQPDVTSPATVIPGLPEASGRSDHGNQRGSAAAVDSSTPVVATRAKTGITSMQQGARARGASVPQKRSRSPGTDKDAGRGSHVVTSHVQLLQQQVASLGERLSAMELNTQAGRDAIASFADRLVQENVNLDNRLMELSIATGTHMHTIEETFKRADVCMEELKAAGQSASTAAAHAMASSIGASSSGGTSPGVTRTDLSLLKGHMDEAAATQLQVTMAL